MGVSLWVLAWPYLLDRGGTDWGVDVALWRADTVYAVFWTGFPAPYYNDFLLVKLDPLGNEVWQASAPREGTQLPRALALDSAGNAYVAMLYRDGGVNYCGVVSFDPEGNLRWYQTQLVGDSSEALAVAVKGGRVFVAGYSFHSEGIGDHEQVVLWCLDTSGNTLFTRTWNSGSSVYDVDIAKAVAAGRGDTVVVGAGTMRAGFGENARPVLLFYDTLGNLLDVDTLYDTGNDDWVEDVIVDLSNGRMYVVVRVDASPAYSYVGCYRHNSPLWSARTVQGSGNWKLYGIDRQDTFLVVTGWTDERGTMDMAAVFFSTSGNRLSSLDTLEDHGSPDEVWDNPAFREDLCVLAIGRYNDDGYIQELCHIAQLPAEEGSGRLPFRLWPNPSSGAFRLEGAQGPFRVYDPSGKLVRVYQGSPFGEDLAPGVYYLEMGSRALRLVKR